LEKDNRTETLTLTEITAADHDAGSFYADVKFMKLESEDMTILIHSALLNHYEDNSDSIVIKFISSRGGESSIDQEIEMKGEEWASVELIKDLAVINREGTTAAFYISDQLKLVEK
jgi:hypothetical protein